MKLVYIDAAGTSHTLNNVKFGSKEGFEGGTGDVETLTNSDSSAAFMTRMSHDAHTIGLAIPVYAATPALLETEENKILAWFTQTEKESRLSYTRYDGTTRRIFVYIAKGYPIRTYESNTMCWIEVQFVACNPYWYAAQSDTVADGETYQNTGEFPATVIYTPTADEVKLNGTTVIKAASGKSIIGLTISVSDSLMTVADANSVNNLYKCDVSSTFPLIPIGSVTISGATAKITKRWGNA